MAARIWRRPVWLAFVLALSACSPQSSDTERYRGACMRAFEQELASEPEVVRFYAGPPCTMELQELHRLSPRAARRVATCLESLTTEDFEAGKTMGDCVSTLDAGLLRLSHERAEARWSELRSR